MGCEMRRLSRLRRTQTEELRKTSMAILFLTFLGAEARLELSRVQASAQPGKSFLVPAARVVRVQRRDQSKDL
jgi:hypothetical protein